MIDAPLSTKHPDASLIDQPQLEAIIAAIDFNDPSLTVAYGAQTMTEIAQFADGLLSKIKAKDAGEIGESLTNLMVQVKNANLDSFGKKNVLQNIPLLGSFFNSTQKTLARFTTLSGQVDVISRKLDQSMIGLINDIQILEQLYEHNKVYNQNLSLYIEAGQQRVKKAREDELPHLQEKVKESTNSMAAQEVRDFAEKLNRFERRLHDLQLSRTITLQTAPQIRLIQSNNQILAEKIQTSVLSTIPIWKSQMVLALSIQGQKNAAALQHQVAETTNEMLRKNAAMLKTASVETAKEVERSVIDIKTVRDIQSQLLATIEETLKIAQEGRERRVQVEQELILMESDLRIKLVSLASTSRQDTIKAAAGESPIK